MNGSLPGALYTAGPRQSIYTRGRAKETNRRRSGSLPKMSAVRWSSVSRRALRTRISLAVSLERSKVSLLPSRGAKSGIWKWFTSIISALRPSRARDQIFPTPPEIHPPRPTFAFVRSVSFFLCPEYRQRQYCFKFGRLLSAVRLVHRGQTFHSSS